MSRQPVERPRCRPESEFGARRGRTRPIGPGLTLGALVVPLLVVPLLLAPLLVPSTVRGQDALGLTGLSVPNFDVSPEAEMRVRVAAVFPEAWRVRFRKVRPIATEAGQEAAFCGQVSDAGPDRPEQNFQLFLYSRTAETGTVRILGSEALNGYRVGRKMIGALKRAGCL